MNVRNGNIDSFRRLMGYGVDRFKYAGCGEGLVCVGGMKSMYLCVWIGVSWDFGGV
jgi:hypothetical protein